MSDTPDKDIIGKRIEHTYNSLTQSATNLEKAILTVSTASFGFSIAFLGKLFCDPTAIILFKIGSFFFAASISMVIISLLSSIQLNEKTAFHLSKLYIESTTIASETNAITNTIKKTQKWLWFFRITYSLFYVLAIIFILLFIFFNT